MAIVVSTTTASATGNAATRLNLYNGALLLCGERTIANLGVDEESRYNLDEVWENDAVKALLERAQWNFAMRSSVFAYDTGITPPFGFRRAFEKPADWILTSAVSESEYFEPPLLRYVDEAGYWYAECDLLYVRYVSSHADYGGDLTKWPQVFAEYAKAWLASKIIHKTGATETHKDRLLDPRKGILKLAEDAAMNHAASVGPTRFPAQGAWSRARGGGGRFNDGGSSSTLIG